jgi:hypothetical protein
VRSQHAKEIGRQRQQRWQEVAALREHLKAAQSASPLPPPLLSHPPPHLPPAHPPPQPASAQTPPTGLGGEGGERAVGDEEVTGGRGGVEQNAAGGGEGGEGGYAGGVGGVEELSADVVLAHVVSQVSPELAAHHCVAGAHEVDRAGIRRVSTLDVEEHVREREALETRVRVTERQMRDAQDRARRQTVQRERDMEIEEEIAKERQRQNERKRLIQLEIEAEKDRVRAMHRERVEREERYEREKGEAEEREHLLQTQAREQAKLLREKEEEEAKAAMLERERVREELEKEKRARRDRELGRGVGEVESKYTKLLSDSLSKCPAAGTSEPTFFATKEPTWDARGRGGPGVRWSLGGCDSGASSLLDCYLKHHGLP